jgi:large subunit ribosomal protein L5
MYNLYNPQINNTSFSPSSLQNEKISLNDNISQYRKDIQVKFYRKIICSDLILKQNYTNIMELPSIHKIVLNTSSKLYVLDKKNIIPALAALELITGQQAKMTYAKKSIASFKIRQHQLLGCQVTLQNQRMYFFLEKFFSVVLPRIRDFSGIPVLGIRRNTTFSLGITQLMIFPELENHFEIFQFLRGININLVIFSRKKHDAFLLYTALQFPVI